MWTSSTGKGMRSTRRLVTGLSSLHIMTLPRSLNLGALGADVPSDDERSCFFHFLLAYFCSVSQFIVF